MSLASRIAARNRKPTATVWIGGRRWARWLKLEWSDAYGQGIASGTVVGRDPPVDIVPGETVITWTWGYDGYEVRGATGIVTEILTRSYPSHWELQVASPLYRASIQSGDISTTPINSITASTAIRQILEGAGLTRFALNPLLASGSAWAGSEWTLGTLTPVTFTGTTRLAAAQQIASTLGYWLYCDPSGTVRTELLERRPSAAPMRTLRWGQDFVLAGPPDRRRDSASVRNRVIVRGAKTGVQGAQIWDEWTSGAGDRTLETTFDLIEYVNESEAGVASCTGTAKRMIGLWSREPNVITIPRLNADPRLGVGVTVGVQCANIGIAQVRTFFVYQLSTTLDRRAGNFSQSLTLDGGTGDQGYTTRLPPEASFAWTLMRETANGDVVIDLSLDGSASRSRSDGEIVAWAWSTSGTPWSGTPSTATGQRAMLIFPASTTSVDVTLTVTDTSGKTGTITQTIPLAGDDLITPIERTISLALGSAWAVTTTGGQAWATESRTACTLVPEIGGETLLATDGAVLRETVDGLASPSTLADTLPSTITALRTTPDTDRTWVGVGKLLYRISAGVRELWGVLPTTINDVMEDPAQPDSVFVLAGADLYHSTVPYPDATWVTLYAGPSGATARHIVRGASGATTWISYTGTFTVAPLQRVEGGIGASWPLGTTPDVTEIRAIALANDEATVYAWDGQGRGWAVASETGIATSIDAAIASGETAQHALYDPDADIVYLATFGTSAGTTYKYLPLADALVTFYAPPAGQQAHRVGIGGGAVVTGEFILVSNSSDTPGGVYHYANGSYTLRNSGLPSGWQWKQIAVSPFSPDDWLIVGSTTGGITRTGGYLVSDGQPIIYRTQDAGVTWTGVPMTDATASGTFRDLKGAGYLDNGQLFAAACYDTTAVVWRGTSSLSPTVLSGAVVDLTKAVAGQDGDILVAYAVPAWPNDSYRVGYVTTGGTTLNVVVSDADQPIVLQSSTSRSLVTNIYGNGYYATTDYRTATATFVTLNVDTAHAFLGDDLYVTTGGYIKRVVDPFGTPTLEIVNAPNSGYSTLVADPTHQRAAALYGGYSSPLHVVYTTDGGATWVDILAPSDYDQNRFVVGVITR